MARDYMADNQRYYDDHRHEWIHGNLESPDKERYKVRRLGPLCYLLYRCGENESHLLAPFVGRIEYEHRGWSVYYGTIMINYHYSYDRLWRDLWDLAIMDIETQYHRARLVRTISKLLK